MKVTDIEFEDKAFRACVLETGVEKAEDITKVICRDKKITSTKGLECLTGLKLLDVTRNQLETLDVSNNLVLEELFAGNNQLQALDLSNNENLKHLEVFINELSDLDVSCNNKLEEIYASKNELTEINLSHNPELMDLRLTDNELKSIDLSKNSKLQKVFIDKNSIDDNHSMILKETLADIELRI